jgi:predicted ATPase
MYISSCQIKNYKGFRESEQIELTSGFNVVVGQNNSGKTALTEALSLRFANNQHRSLKTQPAGNSLVTLTFGVTPNELPKLLNNQKIFLFPYGPNEAQNAGAMRFTNFFRKKFHVASEFSSKGYSYRRFVGVPTGNNSFWAEFSDDLNEVKASNLGGNHNISLDTIANNVCDSAKSSIYFFQAERLNIHQGDIGTNFILESNASNLPQVLHLLQSSNPRRFSRFVSDVRTVFPDIQDIAVTPISSNRAQINVWFVDPETERKDLAVPLSDCGTGIGQVLAMLYVVINSDEPRILLIDEPQSFLHPGAIRKLFEIFKRERNQKHQYIVTTHSPTVVTACSPCNVILLQRKDNEIRAKTIDMNETAETRLFLSEIGARLSDVFGADKILWVEGRTEEICFQRIAEKLLKLELLATEIIGVTHVGDLEGRHKKVVLEIYQKLCEGRGLLPPALGFRFDRENLSDTDMAELTSESKGLIQFIPRRMYENYLLNPEAIATVLNEADSGRETPLTSQEVVAWLEAHKLEKKYIAASEHNEWVKKVDAAKLLNDLFNGLTNARVCFEKLKHGVKITDWIIEHSPKDFDELGEFLKVALKDR